MGIDTVLDEMHAPFHSGIDQRSLIQLALAPFESLAAIRITQKRQIAPRPTAIATLQTVKALGLKTCLVSDCSMELARRSVLSSAHNG